MDDLKKMIREFDGAKLAIDYSDASEDQMARLEEVLNEESEYRPHDGMSYSEHMVHYAPDGFCFLVCDGNCASSFMNTVESCRPKIVKIAEVLKLAGLDEKNDGISEADFDSLF